MAFNFNWSPLTADADFLVRARELLTSALNKSQSPPIIVDDITVNELSLGNSAPELEILEIGDLAEDRFRGIFKMSYTGDAFLTLKTRVQANPLNTYLLTRPAFASPRPLAAATGLTIPLQITLSDIKLSGFIVLVFSRQKGLTLVFRNDPLESLKVSSTFDSIPFVRDHLQKEIEGQLRILLMDELPAIIHRLSLRLWVPEHSSQDEHEIRSQEEPGVNPFAASPPQDAVDSSGNPLNAAEIASLSLDSAIETHALFSRKNLLRLATLTDSHRTLSLFTPPIAKSGDVVFRAWAGPTERGELTGLHTPSITPALSRTQSYAGSVSTTYTFSESGASARPSMQSFGSSTYGLSMGAGRHSKAHGARKRKKRVVNLRQKADTGESELMSEDGSTVTDSASVTESSSSAPSVFSPARPTSSGSRVTDTEPVTPPMSPNATLRTGKGVDRRSLPTSSIPYEHPDPQSPTPFGTSPFYTEDIKQHPSNSRNHEATIRPRNRLSEHQVDDLDATPRASMILPERKLASVDRSETAMAAARHNESKDDLSGASGPAARPPLPNFLSFISDSANGGTAAEQAWMTKMAGELTKRYEEERERGSFGATSREAAPPAYAR